MTLQAHTNAIGTHTLSEPRFARRFGVSTNWADQLVPFDETYYEGTCTTAISRKSPPNKGNHTSPLFYGRSVERVIEDTPFTVLKEEYSHWDRPEGPILRYRSETHGYLSSGEGSLQRYPIPYVLDENHPVAEADTKALLDLGGAKAQLGANLAQARQTVDMFSGMVERGANALMAIKRRDFRRLISGKPGASQSKRASDAWLEYSYGWKPLADDIHNAQQVLCDRLSQDFIIKGKGYGVTNGSNSYNHNENQWEEQAEVKVKTNLHARIANESLRTLTDLGVVNPLSIAWELVPWSFVVDWFIPVGNVLEACTATYGLAFDKGWRTKHMSYKTECRKRLGPLQFDTTVTTPGLLKEEGFYFFRDPLGGFPRPQFYADTTPFSTPRALNALALVRQLMR